LRDNMESTYLRVRFRNLIRRDVAVTVMKDIGRQRVAHFVAKKFQAKCFTNPLYHFVAKKSQVKCFTIPLYHFAAKKFKAKVLHKSVIYIVAK